MRTVGRTKRGTGEIGPSSDAAAAGSLGIAASSSSGLRFAFAFLTQKATMPYNRVQVRAFLTQAEIELFESSLSESSRSLGQAALNGGIKRARTLRDKYRDLLHRQKLATRARTGSKIGTSGRANERTEQKARALDETLTRLVNEATRREAKATASVPAAVALRRALESQRDDDRARVAAKTSRSVKAPAAARQPAPGPAPATTAPKGAAKASRLADSNLAQIQGHTSTQVRRGQAKRDQRG